MKIRPRGNCQIKTHSSKGTLGKGTARVCGDERITGGAAGAVDARGLEVRLDLEKKDRPHCGVES